MKVEFCDLCGNPMKPDTSCTLYATSFDVRMPNIDDFESNEDYVRAYLQYLKYLEKEIKEICPTCKNIIDQIFSKRMIGILKLAKDLKTIYELPTKDETKE